MTHFVVKAMSLYLGPEIQQIIILIGVSFIDVIVMEKC